MFGVGLISLCQGGVESHNGVTSDEIQCHPKSLTFQTSRWQSYNLNINVQIDILGRRRFQPITFLGTILNWFSCCFGPGFVHFSQQKKEKEKVLQTIFWNKDQRNN